MKKLKIIITGGKDQFGAWADNLDGVFGAGDTLDETKQSIKEALVLLQEEGMVPVEEYEFEYEFELSAFLKYYSQFISYANIARITGVHEKQLSNYANGFRGANKETTKRILDNIHSFGKEISQVQIFF